MTSFPVDNTTHFFSALTLQISRYLAYSQLVFHKLIVTKYDKIKKIMNFCHGNLCTPFINENVTLESLKEFNTCFIYSDYCSFSEHISSVLTKTNTFPGPYLKMSCNKDVQNVPQKYPRIFLIFPIPSQRKTVLTKTLHARKFLCNLLPLYTILNKFLKVKFYLIF